MRDYSFGNFISTLRERCGLSQYQLGVLVGVSDKAVSKWENGASKPRIDTMRKLADVLGVSIDELLTCEYDTFGRERKDLFAMKKEIIKLAQRKMGELYGDNPPIRIANRFKMEQLMLEDQGILLWMGFFGALQEKLCEKNEYFDIRGAQMGASFIAWLLGGTNINPLPAHYYCPVCKKVEFVSDEKCGIDLPDKKCSCGCDYHKDGFGIDAVNMYPFSEWNEIEVSKDATELVADCLKEYFMGYGIVREIKVVSDETESTDSAEQPQITKYGVFSQELSKAYPDAIITLCPDEYCRLLHEVPGLTIVENTQEKIVSQNRLDITFSPQQIHAYFDYAVKNGKFIDPIRNINLATLISGIQNPTFGELLSIYGFLHGTGAWKDNAEILYEKGIPLDELICCREDVYSYLYDKLNGKCCDIPSGQAFEIKKAVSKGKYARNRMPEEIEQLLYECDVPVWYVESMKKISYLFPKTHLIMLLKRDISRFIDTNQ